MIKVLSALTILALALLWGGWPSRVAVALANGSGTNEAPLTEENAYNPIPSPDGKYVGYVRVGWGSPGGSGGFGRSNLASDVKIIRMDRTGGSRTVAEDFFLSGWTPESDRLVCFRDWKYAVVTLDGKKEIEGHIPMNEEQSQAASEWVAFSAYFATVIWSRWTGESQRAIESKDHVIATDSEGLWPERPIPSPDGKYIAAFREYKFGDPELRIFDVQRRSWVNFGKITIHPDFENWLYIQPNWNPWFADSSRLVFIQDSKIVIASPAGYKMDELSIEGPSGLPTPSPNGKFIAYVTYTARPMNHRPDLKFWGGTTVMTVSVAGNRKSQPVTEKNPDEVYDLKWLNDSSVIFDRVADDFRFEHARIWKASLKN